MSSFLSSSSSSMPDNDLEMREKERCSRSSLPHVEEEFIKVHAHALTADCLYLLLTVPS